MAPGEKTARVRMRWEIAWPIIRGRSLPPRPAEEGFAHPCVGEQLIRAPRHAVAALGQYIAAIGDAECRLGVLLDHQHADAGTREPAEAVEDAGNGLGRQAGGRLVPA